MGQKCNQVQMNIGSGNQTMETDKRMATFNDCLI